ncbi:hypothetical protein Pfo_009610 [Paulownia fortunei]|nr:hypothetical protein Pfo_009610 [Paulownia fortunei]
MEKVQFLLVLLVIFMASISGPLMAGVQAVKLPHCLVNSDCFPLCGPNCGFCGCFGGICVRGCDGNVPVSRHVQTCRGLKQHGHTAMGMLSAMVGAVKPRRTAFIGDAGAYLQ